LRKGAKDPLPKSTNLPKWLKGTQGRLPFPVNGKGEGDADYRWQRRKNIKRF